MPLTSRLPGALVAAALVLVVGCGQALAQSPALVVRGVYERAAVHMQRGDLTPIVDMAFSRELNDLVFSALGAEQRKRLQEMRADQLAPEDFRAAIGAWPPLIEHDFATGFRTCRRLRDLSVRLIEQVSPTRVRFEARYQLDGAQRLSIVELILEENSWRIDNIVDVDGDWNLREHLAGLVSRAPPAR
mgnify:FL=1